MLLLSPAGAHAQVLRKYSNLNITGTFSPPRGAFLPANCAAPSLFITEPDNTLWYSNTTPICTWVTLTGTIPSYIPQNLTLAGTVTNTGAALFSGRFAPPHGTSVPDPCNPGDEFNVDGDNSKWICQSDGHPRQIGSLETADWIYLGERPSWQGASRFPFWCDVPILSDRVVVKSLRIIADNHNWTAVLCQSRTAPIGCKMIVGMGSSTGWDGDFAYDEQSFNYQDVDGSKMLHFYFNPVGGDWMSPRVIAEYEVH